MMKHLLTYATALCFLLLMAACRNGHGSQGTMFNPKERDSGLTDQQRAERILAMQPTLPGVADSIVFGDGVKLTILSPAPDAKNFIDEQMSQTLTMRMLQIASQNGVSGLGPDAEFALVGAITSADSHLTSTAPQKTMLTYRLTLYVAHMPSATVFASAETELTGVGNNEHQAAANAANSLSNNTAWQTLLAQAAPKIARYYDNNLPEIRARVSALTAAGKYDEAYAVLRAIPHQAADAWKYAESMLPAVSQKMLLKESAHTYALFKDAMARGADAYNPEVGALLARIPKEAPEHAAAEKAYQAYLNTLQANAASEQEWQRKEAERTAQTEFELRKLQIEAETAMASNKSSVEMRKQIAMEDAAGKPWKLLLNNVGYFLNNLFFK